MPINIESTLKGIRQGGTLPKNTLAGQVYGMQQARQRQQADILQAMQAAQLEQQKEKRQGLELAHDVQESQREAAQKRLYGVAQQIATMAERDPTTAMKMLQNSPRVAQAMGIDPRNPDLNRVVAFRDRMRAQVEGDIPDTGDGTIERSAYITPDSPEGQALGLERGAEVKYEGQQLVPDRDDPNYNVVGLEYVGPQQEAAPSKMEVAADEAVVEEWNRYIEEGDRARDNARDMEAIQASVESGSFQTGFAGNLRSGIGSMLNLLGMDPAEASELIGNPNTADVIEGSASQIQMRMAEDLGRVTNMSLNLVKNAVPGLLKTPEGNKTLANLLQRVAEFKAKRSDIAREYRQYGTDTPKGLPSYNEAVKKLNEEYKGITEEQENMIKQYAVGGTWDNPLPAPDLESLVEIGNIYYNNKGVPLKAIDRREDGSVVWKRK